MNGDFGELAKQFDVQAENYDLQGSVENTGTTSFLYEHQVGEHIGLFGKFITKYKDRNNTPCDKTSVGAVRSHGQQQIIIAKDPGKQLIGAGFSIADDIEYGRIMYGIYITFDSERQWQNSNIYKNFIYPTIPQASIVQGDIKKGDFIVNFDNPVFFYGAPVKFLLEKSKSGKSLYVASLELLDNNINKETFNKRRAMMDALYKVLEVKLDKEKKEREAKKVEKTGKSDKVPDRNNNAGEIESPDSLLKDMGLDS